MKIGAPARCSFRSTNQSNQPSRQAWGNNLQRHELRTGPVIGFNGLGPSRGQGIDNQHSPSQGAGASVLRFARQRHSRLEVTLR